MPNVAGLTILLGADFTSAEQAMDAFNGKVSQFVQQMQTLFASAGVNVQQFQKSFQQFGDNGKTATVALNQTNEAANRMVVSTGRLNTGFNSLGYTSTRVFHGLADLMVRPGQAMLILSNDIPQLITRFRELSLAQQELAAAGKPAMSSLQLLSAALDPMVIAIQLGITALIRFAPELYRWATGADEAAKKAKALADEQKELENVDNNSQKQYVASADKLRLLVNVMGDSSNAMNVRIAAMKEAKSEYPTLLDNYSKEDLLNKNFAKTLENELIPKLYAAALMRAALAKSDIFAQKDLDNSLAASKALQDYNKALKEQNDYKAQHPNAQYADLGKEAVVSAGTGAAATYDLLYSRLVDKTRQLAKSYLELGGAALIARNSAKEYLDVAQQQAKVAGETAFDTHTKGNSGTKQTPEDVADRLKRQFELIDNIGGTTQDVLKKKIQATDSALKTLTDTFKLSPSDSLVSGMIKQLDDLKVELATINGNVAIKLQTGGDKSINKSIVKQADDAQAQAKKNIDSMWDSMDKEANKHLKLNNDLGKKELSDLNEKFTDTVSKWNNIIGQPIKTFYDDLLQGKNVFKDLAKSFEEMVANMLAKATEAGIISALFGGEYKGKTGSDSAFGAVFKTLLGGRWGNSENPIQSTSSNYPTNTKSSSNLGVKDALNVGLKSLSLLDSAKITNNTTNNIQNAQVSQGSSSGSAIGEIAGTALKLLPLALTFLADGGVVTGPTLAMVGEAGKEAVIPLDKLNQFTGNAQNLNVNVRGVATGRDLSIVGTNYDTYKAR